MLTAACDFFRDGYFISKWNRSWNLVSVKESRLDSSTTTTLTSVLTNSYVTEESLNAGIKHLIVVTRRDGAIDFSQGDTKELGD
jgi:unsaturated rhamnogalacturonyl hydrolase